jgi:hypothetical protein
MVASSLGTRQALPPPNNMCGFSTGITRLSTQLSLSRSDSLTTACSCSAPTLFARFQFVGFLAPEDEGGAGGQLPRREQAQKDLERGRQDHHHQGVCHHPQVAVSELQEVYSKL